MPALFVLLSLVSVSCEQETPNVAAPTDPAEPTRDAAVTLLENFASLLEGGDIVQAAQLMSTPPNMSQEQKEEAVEGILEKKEISSAGVAILAEEGTWGPLTEVFSDRGARWAERWELAPEDCWALSLEPAEVALIWTDEKFLLFRCDDVGKLETLSS